MELLKFEADWCGPCKMQSDILEDFDKIPVREIDIEEEIELTNKYNVRSVPTLILRDKYKVYTSFNGITELSEIEEALEVYS